MRSWTRPALGGWCLVMLLLAGCNYSSPPSVRSQETPLLPSAYTEVLSEESPTLLLVDVKEVNRDERAIRVSGPYVHENMAVYLVHADEQEKSDFLTLDEGMAKGLVEITVQDQQQVAELLIDNKSDRPLYLQEGERIEGGKQDRTIASTLVIAAHSGKQALPAFCVEHGRWTSGERGKHFTVGANTALAPKGVRGAAKFEKNQNKIWHNVAAIKGTTAHSYAATYYSENTNSSVNEVFDSPRIRSICKECTAALAGILDKHPDAVGVAITVNGQFEEADIYPNHALLGKIYPRLLQSYAVRAALLSDQAKAAPSLSAADIMTCLRKGSVKKQHAERLDARNLFAIRQLDQNRFECTSNYEGRVVNWQMMRKNGLDPASARQRALGTDW